MARESEGGEGHRVWASARLVPGRIFEPPLLPVWTHMEQQMKTGGIAAPVIYAFR